MKKGTIIGIILIILLGVFSLVAIAGVNLFATRSSSVSIIGGADGPTAVFVAGSTGGGILVPAIFIGIILVVVIVAVVVIVKKNREEK